MSRYQERILSIINSSRDHLTADEVFCILKKEEPGVVRATVYNNLNALHDAGKIRRIALDGMPDRYDRTEKHDHLICMKCGKLSDIVCEDFTASIEKTLGAPIQGYDLRISWICPECREN